MFKRNYSERCDYVPHQVEDFAVLLKGTSLEKVADYHDRFNDCFIVSDYDDELKVIGKYLLGKNIHHFTNRSRQSALSRSNYKKYKINTVQTGQVFRFAHRRLMETYIYYKMLMIGSDVYYLPEKLLGYHKEFGEEYALKFPNTGILSLIYTLEMIKPKRLWVFGMDFYATPYMSEQTQGTTLSLDQQAGKMDRLDLQGHVFRLFESYPDTQIMMGSYYKGWSKINNMTLLEQ